MGFFMDKDKQWAVCIGSIVKYEGYSRYREAVEKEVFRLAGAQEPLFLAGMKYLLELPEAEFIKLNKGVYGD
jgi:hypothetical protein